MSSRAARKLMKLRADSIIPDHLASKEEGGDHDENAQQDLSEEEPVSLTTSSKKKKANLFALLNGGDDADEPEEPEPEEEPEEEEQEPAPKLAPSSSSSKKKKKNKGKKKSTTSKDSDDEPTASTTTTKDDSGLDEIDLAIKEVNKKLGELPTTPLPQSSSSTTTTTKKHLLQIDPKNLNPDIELRRMYGSKVIAEELKNKRYARGGPGGGANGINNQRNRAIMMMGLGGKTVLSTPRDTWPRWEGGNKMGLVMDMVVAPTKGDGGVVVPGVFKFGYTAGYAEVQMMFMQCVNSHDPEMMTFLLRSHPYHTDALLQMSEIAKQNGDINTASEYVERALYTYERSFHTLFNLSNAATSLRLSYTHPQNRTFYLSLFKHTFYITRKGCWRTAMELSKLCLSLDPEDDMLGCRLVLDFWGCKAGECEWVLSVWREWNGDGGEDEGVEGLPNWSFSVAWCLRELGHHEKSTNQLKKAMLQYPSMVSKVMAKCTVTDSRIKGIFVTNDEPETESEKAVEVLIDLYVERAHSLWKEPETLQWFRDTAAMLSSTTLTNSEYQNGVKMRKNVYPDGLPLNVCRHIFVSDIQSLMPRLPRYATQRSLHAFDPMPPDLDDNDVGNGGAGSGAAAGLFGLAGINMQDMLRWMMGRFAGVGGQGDDEVEDEEDEEDEDEEDEEEGEEWEDADDVDDQD
ncbi:Transcription factor 25 [Blyttiomyces sp. JEL0837]|nr:Transcription factor 25 [Blyttiomyces sp. JEL0837]